MNLSNSFQSFAYIFETYIIQKINQEYADPVNYEMSKLISLTDDFVMLWKITSYQVNKCFESKYDVCKTNPNL